MLQLLTTTGVLLSSAPNKCNPLLHNFKLLEPPLVAQLTKLHALSATALPLVPLPLLLMLSNRQIPFAQSLLTLLTWVLLLYQLVL